MLRWTYGTSLRLMQAKITNTLLSKLKPESTPYEVNDTELKGFLLRVQPSGVISFYCAYRNKDRKRNRLALGRHPTVTTAQARDHARQVLARVVHGDDPAQAKKIDRAVALKAFISDEYEPWVLAHRKDGKGTVARLRACFSGFDDTKLAGITPLMVERWRTRRVAENKKPSSINRDLSTLKAALAKAVEWGFIDAHPIAKVKLSRLDHSAEAKFLAEPEEERLRIAMDTREERLRLERDRANAWRRERQYPELPSLRERAFADHIKPMVLVSMNTGLRQGELFQLTWDSVDLERANLTVLGGNAKTGKTRHMPLNAEALDVLTCWREQQADTTGLVFPSVDGRRFDNVNRAWHGLLKTANIEDFRWHDLRHHFASQLVMAGVDLNTVRELLGHSDLKMTLRYAHLGREHKAAAVAKLMRAPT
jgi:site-specific recombinase XerD